MGMRRPDLVRLHFSTIRNHGLSIFWLWPLELPSLTIEHAGSRSVCRHAKVGIEIDELHAVLVFLPGSRRNRRPQQIIIDAFRQTRMLPSDLPRSVPLRIPPLGREPPSGPLASDCPDPCHAAFGTHGATSPYPPPGQRRHNQDSRLVRSGWCSPSPVRTHYHLRPAVARLHPV